MKRSWPGFMVYMHIIKPMETSSIKDNATRNKNMLPKGRVLLEVEISMSTLLMETPQMKWS